MYKLPKILSEEEQKRQRRMSISVTDDVYNGVRAMAALQGKTLNDYVFGVLEREVNVNIPAIQKLYEAQKIYQQSLFDASTKKAAE